MRKITITEQMEAWTFDEFVQYGLDNGANVENGMPWSFNFKGFPVTHENDDCYLIPHFGETKRFNRGDMLIATGEKVIFPVDMGFYEKNYKEIPQD